LSLWSSDKRVGTRLAAPRLHTSWEGDKVLARPVSRPFHVINYLGSLGGARVLGRRGMERVMDQVTGSLIHTLQHAGDERLARGMHFPVDWDPYLRDFMTVQDVLHYATQHYQHHRGQLTLSNTRVD